MALDNVFTGANGTLTLAHEDTPEGADASAIMDPYTLQTVGRVTNVEVYVQTDLEEFYQIGAVTRFRCTPPTSALVARLAGPMSMEHSCGCCWAEVHLLTILL